MNEYKQIEDEKVKSQYLASRWALKEAMVKASGNRSIYYPGVYLLKNAKDTKP